MRHFSSTLWLIGHRGGWAIATPPPFDYATAPVTGQFLQFLEKNYPFNIHFERF